MKTLYLECNMGAAGDMLMASLLELVDDKQAFVDKMNQLGLSGVQVSATESVKCGITGTHVKVMIEGEEEHSHDYHEHHHEHDHQHEHHHTHHHASLLDVEQLINGLDVSEKVKKDALAVYQLIAKAEGHVHGKEMTEIHFHEVGTKDAICDVVGVCLLMEQLIPEKIVASPVHVGSGHVHCAHGVLPVPAPATAYLLEDIPIYGGAVRGELCTPTGAALLKYFVDEFGNMPVMRVEKIGYGMGNKDFEQANCVRAMIGQVANTVEQIVELACNLDDCTGEELGFVQEVLFAAGALDVYTTAIGMKKSRPAILLTCMCKEQDREKMLELIFKHTTTLGVREKLCNRYTLTRKEYEVKTPYGNVRVKESGGYGTIRKKAEYEDLARIAREQNISLAQAKEAAKINNS